MKSVKIGDVDVRIDANSGFLCLTDLAGIRGNARDNMRGWMKNTQTIRFFEAWEKDNSTDKEGIDFEGVFRQNRDNSFYVSASILVEVGCQGIAVKRGRYGGTYCHIDWATHFANWLDPEYYVFTIRALRELTTRLYGKDQNYLMFSRQLAAKNYGMITEANDKRKIASPPNPMTAAVVPGDRRVSARRHLKQVDADILNLALWSMTAKQWRVKFQPDDSRVNMRDFATAEELNTMASLQVILRHLQEDQYTKEEMLDRLTIKAKEFVRFYCDTPEKKERLTAVRKKRGW